MSWEMNVEFINDVADRAARKAAAKIKGSSVEDLRQDCWVWVMSHQHKLDEWHEDMNSIEGKLFVSLYHHCLDSAQREKAERDGYKIEDNFYYSLTLLRKILPWWFEEGPDSPPEEIEEVLPDRNIAVDLERAWKRLPAAHRGILRRAFEGDPDIGLVYQSLAVEWECSDDAARMRVTRSLQRLQDRLGGPRPSAHKEPRKVRSNAAARAALSAEYGG